MGYFAQDNCFCVKAKGNCRTKSGPCGSVSIVDLKLVGLVFVIGSTNFSVRDIAKQSNDQEYGQL